MAAPLLNIAFDPASLSTISHLSNFGSILSQEITPELEAIGEMIAEAMTTNTWQVFAEPTGQLADAITPVLTSPLELIIQVNVPYAWRMEEGFFGADSLGRVYSQQGKPYALPALVDNEDQIAVMMNIAIGNALAAAAGR